MKIGELYRYYPFIYSCFLIRNKEQYAKGIVKLFNFDTDIDSELDHNFLWFEETPEGALAWYGVVVKNFAKFFKYHNMALNIQDLPILTLPIGNAPHARPIWGYNEDETIAHLIEFVQQDTVIRYNFISRNWELKTIEELGITKFTEIVPPYKSNFYF